MCFFKIEKWSQSVSNTWSTTRILAMKQGKNDKNDSITWGENTYFFKNGLLKRIRPPFVIYTVQTWSLPSFWKSQWCDIAVIQQKKKKKKKNCRVTAETGSWGLQPKMPYHVLKLSSVGEKAKKDAFVKVQWGKNKNKNPKRGWKVQLTTVLLEAGRG